MLFLITLLSCFYIHSYFSACVTKIFRASYQWFRVDLTLNEPPSESKVGSTLNLTRIAPSILLRRVWFQTSGKTRVRHANVPWLIQIDTRTQLSGTLYH